MNFITFVSARCCVQEGLFGTCWWTSISHALVFGLVLILASAESPVWAYITADCGEHMSLLTVDIDFVPSHRLYPGENMSAILETPS